MIILLQNAICKRVRKTVKKKKDKQPFIHKKTKKMRKKTNSGKKTRANTKNGNKNVKSRKRTRFGSRPHGSPKFIQELKTLLFTTLAKSQQNNNYARNQYRNDIDQMHLIRLMENISCPKFVFNDAMAQDCNNRYGTDDYSKKSEPLESELDEVSWWAKSKGKDFVKQYNVLKYRNLGAFMLFQYPKDHSTLSIQIPKDFNNDQELSNVKKFRTFPTALNFLV